MPRTLKSWSYLANGSTLRLDEERCVGCGLCLEVCPHGVFSLNPAAGVSAVTDAKPTVPGKAAIVARESCMECGACARNCPTGALSVRPGVGCAVAVLNGLRRGGSPDCGCCEESGCC